ncbi:MAG TPA: transporter, partial [Helicobacteraceae bacterium]|nr:transporter [Helicobacteraceae bacterium]
MNQIEARISAIETYENINMVVFDVNGISMRMMALALPENYMVGTRVMIGAKATHIALALESSKRISIANQIPITITKIENGHVLCRLFFTFFDTTWESVITLQSAQAMQLH